MRVGVRCDAGRGIGVGHLVRCVALAEELVARGAEVLFLGDLGGVEWARAQLWRRRLSLLPAAAEPARFAAQATALGLGVVVLDRYDLPEGTGAALRGAGVPVLHVIDAPEPRQEADLYLDQNLGAEARYDPGTPVLAGARYALLRDDVVREGGEVRPDAAAPPRVLCFFGGTDAAGVTGRWLRALADTGVPCVCTAVGDAPAYPGMTVIPPTDELPALMARADLVLTAAGSATWELLYLGVPAALTWVAANQLVGYEAVVGNGLATGLGADPEAAVPVLRALLAELAAPGARARLGGPGRALIDGHGRSRVADALLALSRSSSRSAASPWACHG